VGILSNPFSVCGHLLIFFQHMITIRKLWWQGAYGKGTIAEIRGCIWILMQLNASNHYRSSSMLKAVNFTAAFDLKVMNCLNNCIKHNKYYENVWIKYWLCINVKVTKQSIFPTSRKSYHWHKSQSGLAEHCLICGNNRQNLYILLDIAGISSNVF